MPENIINFLNSKDMVYDDFRIGKKLIFLLFFFVFTVLETIFFVFDIKFLGKTVTILDLVVVGLFSLIEIINFIIGCVKDPVQIHYLYYGIIFLLLSCYFFYLATRLAVCVLSEWFGFLGIAVWVLVSIICILGVLNNIKHDLYNVQSKQIVWIREKSNNEDYGIVVTRYTVFGGLAVSIYAIVLAIIFFAVLPEFFPELLNTSSGRTEEIAQLIIFIGLLLLGYIANFGWKLVIKQIFIHNYGIHVKIQPSEEK